MLEALCVSRSPTATQHVPVLYTGTSVHPCIDDSDTLTLLVQNNAVPGAFIQIDVYYALGA